MQRQGRDGQGQLTARNVAISLLQRHVDEASFLWSQRELCAGAPHHDLQSLGEKDALLEAHLDALEVSGNAGWSLCKGALEDGDAGVFFAAAALCLERSDAQGFGEVLERASSERALMEGVRGALGWSAIAKARPVIERLLGRGLPAAVRRVGLASCADRRINPGKLLDEAVADADAGIRATALRAIGVLGDVERVGAVRACYVDADRGCRAEAIGSGTLLGDGAARGLLSEMAFGAASGLDSACEIVALLEEDRTSPRDMSTLPPRLSARYAGASGDPRHVAWLVTKLSDVALARVAGEALTMITGVDFTRPPLRAARPAGFESQPNDDPADPVVAMDPDDDLPWPDRATFERWWATKADNLPKTRSLLGATADDAWLVQVLREGKQRQRALAALALKLRRPKRPLFNVRAPAFRQAPALTPA